MSKPAQALGADFLQHITPEHGYGEIFQALSSVLFSQMLAYIIHTGRPVEEKTIIAEMQKFLNATGRMAKSALEDPIFLAAVAASQEPINSQP